MSQQVTIQSVSGSHSQIASAISPPSGAPRREWRCEWPPVGTVFNALADYRFSADRGATLVIDGFPAPQISIDSATPVPMLNPAHQPLVLGRIITVAWACVAIDPLAPVGGYGSLVLENLVGVKQIFTLAPGAGGSVSPGTPLNTGPLSKITVHWPDPSANLALELGISGLQTSGALAYTS